MNNLSSWRGATTLIGSIFGGGILTIPYAMSMAGTFSGVSLIILIGALNLITLGFLQNCWKQKAGYAGKAAYADIVEETGRGRGKALDILMITACFLAVIMYGVILSQNLSSIVTFTSSNYVIPIIVCVSLFIINLFAGDIRFLSKISVVTIFSCIFLAGFLLIYSSTSGLIFSSLPTKNITSAIGFLIFSFGGHQTMCSNLNSMGQTARANAFWIASLVTLFVCGIYMLVGHCGSALLGKDIGMNFLNDLLNPNFANSGTSGLNGIVICSYMAQAIFSSILCVAYAINSFAIRGSVLTLLNKKDCRNPFWVKFMANGIFTRAIICLFQGVVCYSIIMLPQNYYKSIFGLVGGICGGLLNFIIPSIIFIYFNSKNSKSVILGTLILFFTTSVVSYITCTEIIAIYCNIVGTQNTQGF